MYGGTMYKVMIVEDEPWLRESLQCYLTLEGHECRLAGNGAEALELLEHETFDAVVTDIMMPEMDGITMMKEIARRRFRPPVMVITGGGLIDSREEAFAAGAQGFVEKPFSPVEFFREFDRMMREHGPVLPDMRALAELEQPRKRRLQV